MIYYNDSIEELCGIVLQVIRNIQAYEPLAKEAYYSVITEQNGVVAANRFSSICEALINRSRFPNYDKGPMSMLGKRNEN